MISLTKVGEGTIEITGAVAPGPNPIGTFLDGSEWPIGLSAPFSLGNYYEPNSEFEAWLHDGVNYGAVKTDTLTIPDLSFPFPGFHNIGGGEYLFLTFCTVDGFFNRYTMRALAFPINLDDTQQLAVAPTIDEEIIIDCPNSTSAVFTNSGPMWFGANPGVLGMNTFDGDPAQYAIAGIWDGVSLTAYNAYFFPDADTNPGESVEPSVTFEVVPGTYLTFGIDFFGTGLFAVAWNPEPFGGDWESGTFTNTAAEPVIFDDPAIQAAVEALDFYVGAQTQDRFFMFFFSLNRWVEVFPATQTYNVYETIGLDAIGDFLAINSDMSYNGANYTFQWISLTEVTYGTGVAVFADASVYVPRFVRVPLPCFVNCIPVIDRRYSR